MHTERYSGCRGVLAGLEVVRQSLNETIDWCVGQRSSETTAVKCGLLLAPHRWRWKV